MGFAGFFKDGHQLLKPHIFVLCKSNFLGFEPAVGAARCMWIGVLTGPVQAGGNSCWQQLALIPPQDISMLWTFFIAIKRGFHHLTSGKYCLLGLDITQM